MTLFNVPAESWSALGIWVTCLVYVALARIAYIQYQESQRSRSEQREQAKEDRDARLREQDESRKADAETRLALQRAELRPFVLVDIDTSRRTLFALKVENIGRTAATEVSVRLDSEIESAWMSDEQLEWQQSPMFVDSAPLLAPGQRLSFPFDLTEDRFETGLPTLITGTKLYRSHDGSDQYEERFDIDLRVFKNALLAEPGFRELINEVKETRKGLTRGEVVLTLAGDGVDSES